MKNVLARRDGLALCLLLLQGSGAMCPKCSFGTRVTSKRWAKCKRCGERVGRRSVDEVAHKLLSAASNVKPDGPSTLLTDPAPLAGGPET